MMSLSDPEHLDLLHRRLLLAEEEAQGIIRSMGTLGVTSEDILGPAEIMAATQRDSLVSRVSRMESLLQTLKLTLFRLETERELDPSHSAHVKQELAALQQEAEEEQQACRREVMRLRQQLQQAHRERDEARAEVQGLQETVEAATVAKMDQMDVAAAAQELKSVKAEMSQKMKEMKEQMRQEAARSAKAVNSRRKLLRRLEEMEGALEVEKRQTLLLQSQGRLLSAEVKTGRQQLEEERDRGRRLEELCQRLREKTVVKESHMFELTTELEAERSRVAEQLLRATARNAHTELQVALTHNVHLQEELEKLKVAHAGLLQSCSTAQQTIDRLQVELSAAQREQDATRKELEGSKDQLCLIVTKLEGEKKRLETQLSDAQQEVGSLSSALQRQQEENKRLMGNVATSQQQQANQMPKELNEKNKFVYQGGKFKTSELETSQSVSLSQSLGHILTSNTRVRLQQEQELVNLKDRLKAQREIRKHQEEVEKLQRLLTSSHSENNGALESLQRALDTVTVDNRKLAHRLQQAVHTNSSLHSRLEQSRDQYQATISLREKELHEAQTQVSRLCEELGAVKLQRTGDCERSMRTLLREISQLKVTVEDSSTRSGDLSEANDRLQQRVCDLERVVSTQRGWSRGLQEEQDEEEEEEERSEESVRIQHQNELTDSKQISDQGEVEWERWTSTIQRWEGTRHLAEGHRTQLRTHPH